MPNKVGEGGKKQYLIRRESCLFETREYGDVIYNQPDLPSLANKIKSVQFNATLAIKGAIRAASKKKLYQELDFQSSEHRTWLRRLCYPY